MTDQNVRQAIVDNEHLKMLSLAYMVYAGIHAFFSMIGLFYMAIGFIISIALAHGGGPNHPPFFIGFFFAGFGLAIFLLMILLAVFKFYAGLCLRRRRSRIFCLFVAAISCIAIPYGTVLGVLTFIVLLRPSVAVSFDAPGPPSGFAPQS
jgi:hypothetical protein